MRKTIAEARPNYYNDHRRGAAATASGRSARCRFRDGSVTSWTRLRITREGREAWEEFQRTEIWRKNPTLPLTAYFDPVAYGLVATGKSKLHVVKVRGAA